MRQLTVPEFATAPSAHELDVLDEATGRFEQRVAHLLESKGTLERRQAELIEFRHVLRETASFFHVFLAVNVFLIGRAATLLTVYGRVWRLIGLMNLRVLGYWTMIWKWES